jgi:hypothetical protein
MRDNHATEPANRPLPLPVVIQPDPMLEEHRAGPVRIAGTAIAATTVVVLALYGMTRPAGPPQQVASAPEAAQAEPAAQGSTEPTTTGKGERSDSATTGNASAPSDKPATPPAQ